MCLITLWPVGQGKNPLPELGRSGYTKRRRGRPGRQPPQSTLPSPGWAIDANRRSIPRRPPVRQGVSHSHPPYAGRPVVRRVRAGNAKPRAWRKVGRMPCQDGLCDKPQPDKASPSVAWWLADRHGGDPGPRANADRMTPAFTGAMQRDDGDRLMGPGGQGFLADRKALSPASLYPRGQGHGLRCPA